MSMLKSVLVKAILIPVALALSLSACSGEAQAGLSAPASSVVATTVSGDAAVAPAAVHTLALKKYKMSTVRKHKTRASCWTVVGKGVYELTKFISKHPGGAKRIIAMCGKNATAAFRRQHGSTGKAARALAKYKIGKLA